jgi:hypothetical protein
MPSWVGCNDVGAASGLCASVSQTLHLAAVLRAIKAHRGAERVTVEEAKSEIEHALVRLQTGFAGLDSSELAWRLERETGFSLEELAAEADQWTPDLTD